MRAFSVTITILGLAAAGAARAEQVTDVDYLKASRCKGLAASPAGAGVDASGLDSFLKAERLRRQEAIQQKGDEVQARAKREAAREGAGPRVAAELNGQCKAYMGAVAGAADGRPDS
jgi:hypothetical protein